MSFQPPPATAVRSPTPGPRSQAGGVTLTLDGVHCIVQQVAAPVAVAPATAARQAAATVPRSLTLTL